MQEQDRAWLRSLPLLLLGGVLFGAGALAFYRSGDTVASIAAMTLAVVLISQWAATALLDWWEATKRRRKARQPKEGTDG
jgi:hypothetical protein